MLGTTEDEVECVAVEQRKIVIRCDFGPIYVSRNASEFPLDFILQSDVGMYSVSILNDNVLLLRNGQIAVSGSSGYCSITVLPDKVRGPIVDCIARLYPKSIVAVAGLHPLGTASESVKNQSLSLVAACEEDIT